MRTLIKKTKDEHTYGSISQNFKTTVQYLDIYFMYKISP